MPTWDLSLSDAERYPLMTDEARTFLNGLREHPQAPVFNHVCGDRLDAPAVARIRAWEAGLNAEPAAWRHGEIPAWLADFAARCLAEVPFYRRQGGRPCAFFDLPLCDRGDLSGATWAFVPDDAPLDQIILYSTSGTTSISFQNLF